MSQRALSVLKSFTFFSKFSDKQIVYADIYTELNTRRRIRRKYNQTNITRPF